MFIFVAHLFVATFPFRSRFESRWLASLARLEVPILVFWGDSDAGNKKTIIDFLVTNLPYITLHT
jgi:hypothetical protein